MTPDKGREHVYWGVAYYHYRKHPITKFFFPTGIGRV